MTEQTMKIDPVKLSEAVAFAADKHSDQTRKRAKDDPRPRIPYISHLMAVSGMVIEDGGDTDEAIAGLLHDYIEDIDEDGADELEQRFGARVRDLVIGCSGPKKEQIPDFRTRKQLYLDHLTSTRDDGAVRVSLADKVHNARSTVSDLETDGPSVWDRFNAGVEDQLWWYGSLSAAYTDHAEDGRADEQRAAELQRLVARMKEFGGQ
ncbi:bifunctional (p)ppGpp synthetase/guanosine-3',5'-bis(diphosphate) 3'-pyrophosphohydrolase [Hoyosella sp. G463]|uniref:Bifunctional (P)ppGpp synthetase/guanosine-3',5'-bis(Diphosphate) 3'-pyrophosphohydrolase n=1 Tax=Lolliginicoccus lacisalsi TaxID=2742202 RepID=A0A927JCR3_9ACTN|nr:HD domain-containing protein [Lolliginicoccus lacisalsi]MBD8506728.1 bifunctional (p)ppGpp synthetase/guanosine-3',5'-bis(diphosphate) 3'-pyrophosphohydrolase [Lolliginicoccus lacisalsi]